jgi:ATP-binding cassette subfamily C protein
VTHRPKSLDGVDHVLVIADGTSQAFGRKDDVLKRVLHNPAHAPVPLRMASEGGRA